MVNERPHALRIVAISCGDATTPSIALSFASRASRTTWLSMPAMTPTRFRSSRERLVSTVTARIFGRRSASRRHARRTSATVTRIISSLPDAWTSNILTPRRAASTPAFATVRGMSWNLRSRKTSPPRSRMRRTIAGPACRKICFPTLKRPTSGSSSSISASASAVESTSSAKISRRLLSVARPAPNRQWIVTSSRRDVQRLGDERGDARRGLVDRHFDGRRLRAALELDRAAIERARPDGDPQRVPDQIGVLELHPGPLLAVVEEDVDAARLELVVQAHGGRPQTLVAPIDGHDGDGERGKRHRPDDAGVVVVLLDRGGDGARHADAVAAHLEHALRAL